MESIDIFFGLLDNQTHMTCLKLGTRRSLLAIAQSRQVMAALQQVHPEVTIELIGLETKGDRLTDQPLSEMEGKDFFVAELDRALLDYQVDLTVHSLKDLSLTRPPGITCAAIPMRENSRDLLLFHPRADLFLKTGRPLRLGTSSPRRLENLEAFCRQALPHFSGKPASIEWIPIRGNVSTRLSRLHEPPDSSRALEGVVLAAAGLLRLWQDPEGRKDLAQHRIRLGPKARWMLLPLTHNPTAPGQGALAIECRSEDLFLKNLIGSLHHPPTATAVAQERRAFAFLGGGCHQRFGVTTLLHPLLGTLEWTVGRATDGSVLNRTHWEKAPAPLNPLPPGDLVWDGTDWMPSDTISHVSQKPPQVRGSFVSPLDDTHLPWFITHSKAWKAAAPYLAPQPHSLRVWTPGTHTWFQLAKEGLWVEGCTEGFGWDWACDALWTPALQDFLALPPPLDWHILTHEEAASAWQNPGTWTCYQASPTSLPAQAVSSILSARWLYWGSATQVRCYEAFLPQVSPQAHHACGPGRTFEFLQAKGLHPQPFPTATLWKAWVGKRLKKRE